MDLEVWVRIVGGQTLIFRLIREGMYDAMHRGSPSLTVDRGMALHKIIRLATAATAGHGYLNFMGNEFGHPEWIDFPREGNQWSLQHARRQWSLRDDVRLRYGCLAAFDVALLALLRESGLIWRARPQALYLSEADRILAFERAGLYVFLNLHPTRSYSDYEVETLPGDYVQVLDSDQPEFGGFGRLQRGQVYSTLTRHADGVRHDRLRLYLPARTALVLRRGLG